MDNTHAQQSTSITSYDYAGFWLRLVAHAIDTLICALLFVAVCVITLVSNLIIGALSSISANPNDPSAWGCTIGPFFLGIGAHYQTSEIQVIPLPLSYFLLISIVPQLLYYAFFESSKPMATPGKLALGLIVVDSNGRRLSFWRALCRNLGKGLSHLFLNLGFIMAAFTKKKQALHDMMAGCLVVRKH